MSRKQTYKRPIRFFEVVHRKIKPHTAVASPTDFKTKLVSVQDDLEESDGLLPYCINPQTERVILTATNKTRPLLDSAFLYQAQRESAERLATIPFERLHEFENESIEPITFLFSIGRCGSTLFSLLLRSMGYVSISEPDIYTQLAVMPPEQRKLMGTGAIRSLIRFSSALLARHGAPAFIKQRSQCNTIAGEIAEAVPEAKFVYILRDPIGFAESRHRAFGDSPRALAAQLLWGIRAYDALVRVGCSPTLVWYDEIRTATVLRKIGIPEDQITSHHSAILGVLNRDAQQGTSLARDVLARRLSEAGRLEFKRIWMELAPLDLIKKYGLERLIVQSET